MTSTVTIASTGDFDFCGVAALSDFSRDSWRGRYDLLEGEQDVFLSKRSLFLDSTYRWPHDSLHTWSRIWEYPYVYHHLSGNLGSFGGTGAPVVADIGCGITYFPFAVAKLGCKVICADIDPVCQRGMNKAIGCTPAAPGSVEFRLISDGALPFGEGEVDAAYCVSVLEHVHDRGRLVSEMARIVKKGGMLALTFDLDLRGDFALSVEARSDLLERLLVHFEAVLPARTVHPANVLTSDAGPLPMMFLPPLARLRFTIREVGRCVLGRPRRSPVFRHLAVEGMVLRKR